MVYVCRLLSYGVAVDIVYMVVQVVLSVEPTSVIATGALNPVPFPFGQSKNENDVNEINLFVRFACTQGPYTVVPLTVVLYDLFGLAPPV